MGGHHPLDWVGTFARNGWASSVGLGGHLPLDWVGTFVGIRIQKDELDVEHVKVYELRVAGS